MYCEIKKSNRIEDLDNRDTPIDTLYIKHDF